MISYDSDTTDFNGFFFISLSKSWKMLKLTVVESGRYFSTWKIRLIRASAAYTFTISVHTNGT